MIQSAVKVTAVFHALSEMYEFLKVDLCTQFRKIRRVSTRRSHAYATPGQMQLPSYINIANIVHLDMKELTMTGTMLTLALIATGTSMAFPVLHHHAGGCEETCLRNTCTTLTIAQSDERHYVGQNPQQWSAATVAP